MTWVNTLFTNLFNDNGNGRNPQLPLTKAIQWRNRKHRNVIINTENTTVKRKEYARAEGMENKEKEVVMNDNYKIESKKVSKRGRPAFLKEGDRIRISLYLPSEIVTLSTELAYKRRTNRNDLIKTILSEYFVQHKDEFDKKMDMYFEGIMKS